MRVLITRPRGDAEALAAQIHALGHTTLIEPLIDIVFADGPALDLTGAQALLFTSANGARAAARRTTDRTIRILAVGRATGAEARALGFTRVSESTGEGVETFAHTVREQLNPTQGALLHITGTATAGDLKGALEPAGFAVRTEQLYDARPADALSAPFTTELTAGRIDAVTFFSPRTAERFVTLIRAAGLAPPCENVTALALSDAVANALAPLRFRKILAAAHPNAAALLDLLKQVPPDAAL